MALTQRNKVLLSEATLLLCGLTWGTGFVVMKNTLDYLDPNWLLGVRFFLSSIILFLVFHKKVCSAPKNTLIGGAFAGFVIYLAFLAQTVGLSTTTAGNNAFLTAAYVVLVPFILWIIKKKKPGIHSVIAAAICFAGVGVIAVNEGFRVYIGDAWTLLGGVLFAVHIVIVSRYTADGADPMALTCVQFFVSSICSFIVALLFEPYPDVNSFFSGEAMFSVLYLVLFCSVFAMGAQNVGLRYAPAAHASLLMSTEAPFGFLAGIIFLDEPFTLRFFLGAALIAGSIAYSAFGGKNESGSAPEDAD